MCCCSTANSDTDTTVATVSSSAQSVDKEDDIQPSLPAANVSGGMCYLYISILHNNIKLFDKLKLS